MDGWMGAIPKQKDDPWNISNPSNLVICPSRMIKSDQVCDTVIYHHHHPLLLSCTPGQPLLFSVTPLVRKQKQ